MLREVMHQPVVLNLVDVLELVGQQVGGREWPDLLCRHQFVGQEKKIGEVLAPARLLMSTVGRGEARQVWPAGCIVLIRLAAGDFGVRLVRGQREASVEQRPLNQMRSEERRVGKE